MHVKFTVRYLKAKRMIHTIDKRLSELERRLMRARHLKMA